MLHAVGVSPVDLSVLAERGRAGRHHGGVLPLCTVLSDVGQSIHDQAVLSVLVLIQLQQGAAELVQEEALGALISGVKGINNDGLSAFDLTTTERTALTI